MAFSARERVVNPRLGTYFGIFASMFVSLFMLALIFEQLETSDAALRLALCVVPLAIYVGIAFSVTTNNVLDFFAAGRRVPAVFTGLNLGASAVGGTLLVAGTGAFFFAGFDGLLLMMGVGTGFVVMAIVLAPFYRKFGAFTLPSYLGRRFDSTALRLLSANVAVVPMLLVLMAELTIGAKVAAQLTGFGSAMMAVLVACVAVAVTAPGGKRSFTWSGAAQAMALLIALMVVATVASVVLTSLPIPQLANGPMVRSLVRNEVGQGLTQLSAWPLAFGLPGEGLGVLTKPYTQPFASVGSLAFALGTVSIAAGAAVAPWLLPSVAATPGVYEARKSLGWATVIAGLIILTASAIAVFMRDFILDLVMSERVGPLPAWLGEAAKAGFVAFDPAIGQPRYSDLAFDRDSVLFLLPGAAGLPAAFTYLMMVGALAAAVLGTSKTIVSLAGVLAEDIVHGLSWEPVGNANRVWAMRVFTVIAGAAGLGLVMVAPTDPLRLVMWAFGLTGASLFPVVFLSIWWKRLTTAGALASVVAGFICGAGAIVAGESGALPVPSAIGGVLGLPVALVVALSISTLRPETSRHALEVVRDIRVPGGEIIYDREMQKLHLKKNLRT